MPSNREIRYIWGGSCQVCALVIASERLRKTRAFARKEFGQCNMFSGCLATVKSDIYGEGAVRFVH
jgi:hypothetical protein